LDILNSILNNIDEALIVTDGNGKILFLNEVAINLGTEILERPLAIGDDMSQIVSRTQTEIAGEIIREMQVKKSPEKSFAEYKNQHGSTLFLEFNFVPVLTESKELTHIHTFIRDITPQKIFETKLTNQAANISNLIDKANAIIIGVDTRGYITEWNEYCRKITGFEKDEVYAQKFSDVLLVKGEGYFDDLLAKTLVSESVSNYEIPIRTKENKKAIFLLNGTHRTTPTREVTGILFVGQDVTELTQYRKSLERKVEERTRELQQALKKEKEVVEMKSRFISIASHEFRTPLSSIEFATSFIEKRNSNITPDELHGKLDNIKKQVKHMTHLLDDVLTYGKSEAGKIELIISSIVPIDFFSKIIEEVGHSTKNTHGIQKEFVHLPAVVQTDEKLLRNVFINLLTNAIKFSPGKEFVYLTVKGDENMLTIEVRDDGIGIPEEELEKIFEPFIRGKAVGSIQGTGLGLSIVKKAVELLKGSIQAKSVINEGTTFTVKIPTNEN
jgi:PAS domain S-box-containing protein